MTTAAELSFGVEFEVTLPRGTVELGGYHRGLQVEGLPEGWNAQSDCSIHASRGRMGAEIVSPVLRGADGIRQIKQVCDWLTSKGARVNGSTGFHVHVGVNPGDTEGLRRVVSVVANFEKALYAATGTRSREVGRFCRPIQSDETYQQVFHNRGGRAYFDRYRLLNVTNILASWPWPRTPDC